MAVQAQENMGFSHMYPPQDLFSIFQENSNQPQVYQAYKVVAPNGTLMNNQSTPWLSSSSSSSSSSSGLLLSSMEVFQYLASELQKQRAQVDSFLQIQNEKLSMVLQEEARQRGVLLQGYASKLMSFIKQKENDLALAKMRTMELEEILIRSNMEAKEWKNKALENESSVINLTNKINQVTEEIFLSQNTVQNEESFCGSSSIIKKNKICKVCNAQSTCVIFFPCRHLCCCKVCEANLGFCPLCQTVKEQSMEIFLG